MPAKNALKSYVEDSFYHAYNRGVNKRKIFTDKQDYSVFLSYLKTYLTFLDKKKLNEVLADEAATGAEKERARKLLSLNNFFGRIELLAYCLMPNHFHFIFKQSDKRAMEFMMRSLMTRYTMYLNRKLKRVGSLFQGVYKAVLITTDEQLLYLSRYIHRNCLSLSRTLLGGESLKERLTAQPSSYLNYLGEINQEWVKPEFILQNFSESGFGSYESFVGDEDMDEEVKSAHLLEGLELDRE
jgi:putative transposase